MTKYKVEYSYTAPFWGELEVEAVSVEDAENVARDELENTYPEAIELSIDRVTEIVVQQEVATTNVVN